MCLYEDESVLAFDKPAGMHSVPGKGEDKQDCLSARAQALFPEARVVHRLDLDTSGVIVMARGPEAQRRLNRSFELRQIDKRYVAVVQGCLTPPDGDWGLIDLPIALDWERRPLHTVDAATGRPSQTHWHLLAVDPVAQTSRVLLEPFTGRSHQLRVHLQALGHPMLGDRLYGGPVATPRAPRLLLHATQILLPHPESGQALFIESPVPF
ncbi:RluA family pseudouridine synthase [Curvibacter sp. HBC61]|uniref:Dual-specificity RNA pseudouridine synthase RluA n=1 Tax=Curvibacter cyanobacteriorum TaxID=3026422 RepID=A0ABT5MTF4_9BURK|nr:RluA family pseudouridine synthase [Curvibacter sp. HBC61]MDD0837318.1 RluA family pseudouridine synthase [Curvibacter sp. HBC61]